MIDVDAIEKRIRDLVSSLINLKVIKARQNVPRPQGEYLTAEIVTWSQIGRGEQRQPDELGLSATRGLYNLTVTFEDDRAVTGNALQNLRSLFNNRSTLEKFYAINLSFVNASPVRRIPELLDTSWEDRFQMDINFLVQDGEFDDTSYIKSAGLTGDYLDSAGNIVEVVDININT